MSHIENIEAETVRHLNKLIQFRNSGQALEAAKDWLDKEISDLQGLLGLRGLTA